MEWWNFVFYDHFMAKNYPSIAFTTAVKELQERLGSRTNYARMEKDTYVEGLTENEIEFITRRDSFYMASFGDEIGSTIRNFLDRKVGSKNKVELNTAKS